jgi:hypothetical protein
MAGNMPAVFKYFILLLYKFPKLAKVYLAVSTSSAESERVFSIAGKIFTRTRCLLKPNTFEKLMNIKRNMRI